MCSPGLSTVDVHQLTAPDSGDTVFSSRAEGPGVPKEWENDQTARVGVPRQVQ